MIDPAQMPQPQGGWSHALASHNNAIVLPRPDDATLSFPGGVLAKDGAPVHEAAVWRNHRRILLPATQRPNATRHLPGTWLWGGLLYGHFGHFLCESASRLWALDHLREPIEGVVFIARFDASQDAPSAFHHEYLSLMGCNKPLHIVQLATTVDRLIVPGQGFGLGDMAAGTRMFRNAMRNRFAANVTPEGGKKLYISRSGIGPRRGGLLLETRLERHLSAQGYEIFHPQKHSLTQQIARYKAADQILAAEGSALHLLGMVARSDQQIGIVVRRKSGATRSIVRHLHSFAGRAPVVIEAIHQHWMPADGGRKHMSVAELDFPALQAQLHQNGFIHGRAQWPAASPDEAQAEIRKARFRRRLNYQPVAKQGKAKQSAQASADPALIPTATKPSLPCPPPACFQNASARDAG